MAKTASALATAVVALAVATGVQVRAGQAQYYGNAPWCAVLQAGTGSVVWHCYYRTAKECAPSVVAGSRGSCNTNPYWTGPRGAAMAAQPKRHKRYSDERR